MTRPRPHIRRSYAHVTLREALADPALLGNVLSGPSWQAWRILLIASMGEALTDDERTIFRSLTKREREPGRRVEEFVGVIGRRGGKSRGIATLATYVAGLCEHPALVPGEVGVVLCIAPDLEQADITFSYVEAAFRQSPILRQLIAGRTQRTLRLTNGIEIQVRASDFRRLRGPTYVAVIADEVAFWLNTETTSNPDHEILNAVRPGLATTGGMLFLISSPHARRGELWRLYQKHFGPHSDPLVLVAQAPSRTMNPTLPESVVTRAQQRDAASAAAEFGAQFRTDLEAFVALEAVQACITRGIIERPPKSSLSYYGFVDPSGGSSDSFSLAIGHIDYIKQSVVLDCIRERKPPFSPEQVTEEYATLLKTYRVHQIKGDRYAGLWPVEQFAKFGIHYEQSAAPKSDLYRDLLPLLNSGRVDLLDIPKLVSQLIALERRTSRGGRDSIDHPPGGHDDVVNALAGLAAINTQLGNFDPTYAGFQPGYSDDDNPMDEARAARAFRNAQMWSAILSGVLDR